ncbi:hypothetical protein GCM10019016_007190 [Streptomyces prasinosporus]|uniref:Response regulatory domain-containing protein n=1 Tax=Streptomyces prasinosporus TaxID=68256 RepID=A0ABP6TFL7_9ACTN
MLTISDEEADLYDAIKAGATGYLLKEISTDEVATAIRAVADGPVADQPLHGVETAHRVQVDDPADRRAPARAPRRG